MLPPAAPNLAPIDSAGIIAEINNAGINEASRSALQDEGFTEAMTLAFLNTARETNTIVSSRVPGKACTELIAQGHDLKGFQIKCKSCDWGPMAGFLCQLPFFNKAGYSKIGYNTGYIVEYLEGLARFSGTKTELAKLNLARIKIKTQLMAVFEPAAGQKLDTKRRIYDNLPKLLAVINAATAPAKQQELASSLTEKSLEDYLLAEKSKTPADQNPFTATVEAEKIRGYIISKALESLTQQVGALVTANRAAESKAGVWAGENTLPAPGENALLGAAPFVQLKRKFTNAASQEATPEEVVTQLLALKGVATARKIEKKPADENAPDKVIGLAYDKISAPGLQLTDNGATIKMEFMLQRDANDRKLWLLYHRDISYRPKSGGNWTDYEGYAANNAKTLESLGIDPGKYESPRIDYVNKVFSRDETKKPLNPIEPPYYPLCGIMNPHPPYPTRTQEDKDNPDFYKNAVSGDYDLFAFWPAAAMPDSASQLVRLSERNLKYTLKVAYPNPLFCFDFIPGFKEIDKQEDAEKGNMNNLGELVASLLNSQSRALDIRLASKAATPQNERGTVANKAFHSDEGGRPGILEIEFPIAVFFPKKIKTKTLGAVDANGETAGGLVTTITNFLQLLLDINYTIDGTKSIVPKVGQYKIILQSEWMMHLFFLTLPADTQQAWPGDTLGKLEEKDFAGETNVLADKPLELEERQKKIAKRIKEFQDLREPKKLAGYNPLAFASLLQTLLSGQTQHGTLDLMALETFAALQKAFLSFAFESDKYAVVKRIAVETIVYKEYIDGPEPAGAPQ
jgi:hypothetical protein